MTQTVIQIGNSLGVTIPVEFVKRHHLKKGAKMAVASSNGHITLSTKVPKTTQYQTATNKEWFDLMKEVESRYGSALEELAKLQ